MPYVALPLAVALLLPTGATGGPPRLAAPESREAQTPARGTAEGKTPRMEGPEVAPPSRRFEEGKIAFARGQYRRAIDVLRPLIHPDVLLESESDLVLAHRMLGVALLFENQPGAAREEFRQLLELRPESRFDPLLDPPFIVDFFNGVLRDQQVEIKRLEQLRDRSNKTAPPLGPGPLVAVRNPSFVSFVPFGAGQFQNGERGKGWAFLAAEGSLAAISVGAFVANFALYGLHPRRGCSAPVTSPNAPPSGCPAEAVDHGDEDTSRNLTRLQVGSGVLFFAAAIWGVVDAVRGYRPITFEKIGERPRAMDASLAPKLHLGFASGGTSTAGLSFRF